MAGAILGAAGVVLGAFGAHGLADRLPAEALSLWDTAVRYHLVHALALLVAGLVGTGRAPRIAALCFAFGIVLFSGSLYLLALGGPGLLGPLTPIGGLLLVAGWLSLAMAGWRPG